MTPPVSLDTNAAQPRQIPWDTLGSTSSFSTGRQTQHNTTLTVNPVEVTVIWLCPSCYCQHSTHSFSYVGQTIQPYFGSVISCSVVVTVLAHTSGKNWFLFSLLSLPVLHLRQVNIVNNLARLGIVVSEKKRYGICVILSFISK